MGWVKDTWEIIVYTFHAKTEREDYESEISKLRTQVATLVAEKAALIHEHSILVADHSILVQEQARLTSKIHELEIALEVARGENDKLRQREKNLLKEVHEWSSLALEYRPKHLPPLMPPTP